MNVTVRSAAVYAVDQSKLSESLRQQLMQTFGCVRKIQNLELDWFYNVLLPSKGYVSGELPAFRFPETTFFKNRPEYAYLRDVDSLALSNAKIALENAVKKFSEQPDKQTYRSGALKRAAEGGEPAGPRDIKGMPRFKSRARGDFSYTTNNQPADGRKRKQDTIRLTGAALHLPKLKEELPLCLHRPLPQDAVIKTVTVALHPDGKFTASISYMQTIDLDTTLREQAAGGRDSAAEGLAFLGLDYAQKDFYVDSEGKTANYPHYYRTSEARLAKLQKQLSRMEKGSKNYERKRTEIAKLHAHIANQRKDFCQKLSTALVHQYDVIAVEDIDLRSMAGALSLGKNLHDNGFGMFREMLSYKLLRKGSCLVKVPRSFASTKTCHVCGTKNPDVILGVDEWDCPVCGTHHLRDYNAAINIREKGKEIFADYFLGVLEEEAEKAARAEKLHNSRVNKKRTAV